MKHLILEGGLFGHMSHLHDNPNLTFSELKEILTAASSGELEGTEKTDGQNLYISYDVRNGTARGSRGKGHVKIGGLDPAGLAEKFGGRGALEKTFSDALGAFEEAAGLFSPEEQNEIFGPEVNVFYNAEVQDPRSANVIQYDTRTLLIHRVGHVRYDRETNEMVDPFDAGAAAQALANALERVQRDKKFGKDYDVKIGAMRRLAGLDDDTALRTALGQIEGLINSAGLSDNQTVGDYLISQIEQIILQTAELPEETIKLVISRILKDYYKDQVEGAKENIRVIIASAPEFEEEIRQILANHRQIVSEAIRPLEAIIHDFAVEMLRGLESAFVLDNRAEVDRLRAEVSEAITAIENSGSEEAMEILKTQMAKLKDVEGVSTAAEGFVFDYKGHTYKFTGNFAPMNQLLGLFKYGRGDVPPLQKLDEQDAIPSEIQTIVGVYPGRFQPMGPHHAKVFQKIMNFDFLDNAYVVTSDKVKLPKSPLNFEEKKVVMMGHGIPETNIIESINPYAPKLPVDMDTTAVIFFVGAKDMKENPRFANLDGMKKDGVTPAYLKALDLDNLLPMSQHGYVAVAPHESLEVPGFGEMSGTTIREALKDGDEQMFEQIMGWFDQGTYDMLKNRLGALEEKVDFVDLTRMAIDERKKRKPYMEPHMLQDPAGDIVELDEELLGEAPKAPLVQLLTPTATAGSPLSQAASTPFAQATGDIGVEVGRQGLEFVGVPTSTEDVASSGLAALSRSVPGWPGMVARGVHTAHELKDASQLYVPAVKGATGQTTGQGFGAQAVQKRMDAAAQNQKGTGGTAVSTTKTTQSTTEPKTWRQMASDWWSGTDSTPKPEERYSMTPQQLAQSKENLAQSGIPIRKGLRESEVIDIDDDKLEEISAMAGGAVEGAPGAQGGSFPGLDVAKENEEERKKSKGLKEQDSVISEITNYLLIKKGYKK